MIKVRDITDTESQHTLTKKRRKREELLCKNCILCLFILFCILIILYLTVLLILIILNWDELFPTHDVLLDNGSYNQR